MIQNIETFNHEQFGSLRAVTNGQEPMFVAADVCKALEHSNVSMALARLDEDEKAKLNLGLSGGDTNMVTFPGLLNLVLGSRKPEAKAYKRWVTHEVLPAIHRTGGYMMAGNDETPEQTMARALLIAKDAIDRKDAIIEAKDKVIGEMRPKAVFADAVASSKTSILVGEMAKLIKQSCGIDMGQNRLFDWLRRNGYLMKQGSWYNMPTQKSMELGLFEIKESSIANADGSVRVTKTPKVTGKGQQYFINKFTEQMMLAI